MFRFSTLRLTPVIPPAFGVRDAARSEVRQSCLKSLTGVGACLVALALVLPWHLGRVQGTSMTPTFQPGSFFLYERASLRPEQLQRGDVIVLRYAGELWIKRVYARAGDRILLWHEIDGGIVDRFPVAEAEVGRFARLANWMNRRGSTQARLIRQQIPPDHVYVMGDGPASVDSRKLGPIHASQIVGRVLPFPGQNLGRIQRALEFPGSGQE